MKEFRELKPDEIEQSIPYWFERQVEKFPDQLAVKSRDHELTYRALNQAANRVARAVLARRGQKEEAVALLLENEVSMITAALGVLKAGKFYFPLNPTYPRPRLSYMLSDSQAGLVVSASSNQALARELCDNSLNIEELDPGVSEKDVGLLISPGAIARLTYTSGSSGRAKGVVHSHRNMIHHGTTYASALQLTAKDRHAQLISLSFGAAWKEVFGSLLVGATLLSFDLKEQGLAQLANWMVRERITVYSSMVTAFRQFLGTLTRRDQCPTLRLIHVGGDPLYSKDVELFRRLFSSNCVLINAIGSTETGPLCHYPIHQGTAVDGVVPVGYPLDGVRIQLLDDSGKPIGGNQVGEIVVKSRYLALGYWRKPDLTQTVFQTDPEGGDERVYYTGDLGRMRSDGCLEHLGRNDDQVKIRGHRIEISEIETVLLDHPSVKEIAVVAREDRDAEKRLIAYIVPGHTTATTSELRSCLTSRLPDYMVPSAFVTLDALPVTPSGKVDRRALPEPVEIPRRAAGSLVSPRDALELKLVRIWETVFGVQPIGLREDFFELGGDSLLALRMFLELQQSFGPQLPVDTLLHAPTVEQLAEVLRRKDLPGDWSSLVVMQGGGSRPPLFLVHTFGGNLLDYRELVRLLGPEQPVYGLQPKRWTNGEDVPHSQLEDMAAHYVKAMRAVQPTGPYYLGGFCVAGVVALEMARKLEDQGERVALLAVFDAAAPLGADHRTPLWHLLVAIGFFRNLPSWMRNNLPHRYGHFLRRIAIRVRGEARVAWRRLIWRQPPSHARTLGDFLGDLSHIPEKPRRMMEVRYRALHSYQPKPYPGRITLFRAQALPLLRAHDPQLGWGKLAARGVEVKVIADSNHLLLREPHVEKLAIELRASLAEAQARTN